MKPNQRVYNLAKARVKVAARGSLASSEKVRQLYQANLELAVQRKAKYDYLIQKAKVQKKINFDRLDKLVAARNENSKTIKEMQTLVGSLKK